MKATLVVLLLGLAALAAGKVLYQETFDGDWQSRWTMSSAKDAEGTAGHFRVSAGKWYNDKEADKGLQTAEDARFYIASAPIPDEFSNKDKTLVLQYTVKHEQNIDCGGGYLKLLPKSAFADAKQFKPDSVYNLMFGPDVCGTTTKKTHVIFGREGTNHLVKKDIKCETDQFTHLYTLVVRPDNTYEVLIDNVHVEGGSLEDDWDMVEPKEILDPEAKKPADWVDDPQMDDPEDKKPEGYDDIPALIPDPDAKKPEDWDDETDGEWEAPTIDNPAYKGPWKARRIANPAYKGAWVHPKVPNPAYKPNPALYAYDSFKYVGIEIWQVKAGTIFDNIIIADSVEDAKEWAAKWEATKKGEKVMYDQVQEVERKAAEEARKAEEAKAKEAEAEADDEVEEKDDEEEHKEEL